MDNRNTSIRGLQIQDSFFGFGLRRKQGNPDVAQVDVLSIIADGLSTDEEGKIIVNVDNDTLIIDRTLKVNNITRDKIIDFEGAFVVEYPIVSEKTEYIMGTLAIVSSIQVFLNGLLQEEGSGKDYIYSELTANSVITFTEATEIDDIVIIHYITRV